MPAFPRTRARRDDPPLRRRERPRRRTGDWEPLAQLLRRRTRSTPGTTARSYEFVARGRDEIRDFVFGTEMAGLEKWTYPYVRTLIDDQKGEVIGIWRQIAPGARGRRQALRDRRHRRLVVPLRAATTSGSWQRDFFDHANAGDVVHGDGEGRKALARRCSAGWRGLEDAGLGASSPSSTGTRRFRREMAAVFMLRFDMRAPAGGPPAAELYRAALEMAEWGEAHGCLAVQVSEHHASPDGYLPAPLVLAAAIAGRTRRAADPGRRAAPPAPRSRSSSRSRWRCSTWPRAGASPTCWRSATAKRSTRASAAIFATRGRRMDACLAALQQAFSRRGLRVRGPAGARAAASGDAGRAAAAARRRQPGGGAPRGALRARHGDTGRRRVARGALPLRVRAARTRAGPLHRSRRRTPSPRPSSPRIPTRAWERLGPHLLHDARMYAANGWARAASVTSKSSARERRRAARREGALSHLHAGRGDRARARATACC